MRTAARNEDDDSHAPHHETFEDSPVLVSGLRV